MQLASASEQAEAKRMMDLRREVYLPAVRAAAEATALAGMMLDVNTPDDKIVADLKRLSGDMAGVHVAASDENLRAVIALASGVGRMFMEANTVRARLKIAKAAHDTHQGILEREQKVGDALIERMREHNLAGGTPEQWKRIQDSWATHQTLLTKNLEKTEQCSKVFLELNATSIAMFAGRLDEIALLQSNALFALRGDLNLPLDEEKYLEQLRESTALAKGELQKTAEVLHSLGQPGAAAT